MYFLAVGACFEEPVKIFKSSISTFLASQGSVLNLEDVVIPFSHNDIKIAVVRNLVKTGHKFPVKTFKALRDIERSIEESTDPLAPTAIDTETSSEVIHACFRGAFCSLKHSHDISISDLNPINKVWRIAC